MTVSRNLEVAVGLIACKAAIPLAEIAKLMDRRDVAPLEAALRIS